jgi:hypothetical protein
VTGPSRHRAAAVIVGLAVIAVALVMPEPSRPAPPGRSGPSGLTDAWPSARTTTIAATLPDGSTYLPLVIVDGSTSVGLATTVGSDGQIVNRLVMQRAGPPVRLIRTYVGAEAPWVIAHAVTADHLYWLENGAGADEELVTTLWRVGLAGGRATRLARDAGEVRYGESASDLVVADGRVHWMVAASDGASAVRSVSVDGGRPASRGLAGVFTLTTWPWATTTRNGAPGPATLLNIETGQRRTVAATPDEVLDCTLVWCRVTASVDDGQRIVYEIVRVDGSERRRIGDESLTPLNGDVALLERFEVLGAVPESFSVVQSVWLYDLTTGRSVRLTDAASGGVRSHDRYLWWPTGDNEAMVWHVLDLRQLT